jgi:hypothetical protein
MYKLKEDLSIENMIYEIRGKQVMLDSDLARLYECTNGTKTINQAVKRHINKFPERYMFQLNELEFKNICGPNLGPQVNKIRTMPYAFTEQGVAMLATILKTPVADIVSMKIIDAFVYMKRYLSFENKNSIILNHENRILKLEESFDKLNEKEKINAIFYEGQIYDAYSLLIDIFKEANEEIIIIDNYADKSILDMITNLNVEVTIVTRKFNLLKDIDIKKYNRQYHNLKVIYSDKFHDRFVILDKKVLYNSGASFKDLGKKCFSLNKIEDNEYLKNILKKIKE